MNKPIEPLTEYEQATKTKLFRDAAELKREYKLKDGDTTARIRGRLRTSYLKLVKAVMDGRKVDKASAIGWLQRLGIADRNGLPVPEFGGEPSNRPIKKKKRK